MVVRVEQISINNLALNRPIMICFLSWGRQQNNSALTYEKPTDPLCKPANRREVWAGNITVIGIKSLCVVRVLSKAKCGKGLLHLGS